MTSPHPVLGQEFFGVRPQSIPCDIVLPFDIYLHVNNEYVHFRNRGEIITQDRMANLLAFKLREVFIPLDQKELYQQVLKGFVQNTDLKPEVRGKYIKECAFNHVSDLFTKPDVKNLVQETSSLVSEMVNFITGDMEGALTLMRLSKHDYYTYNHCVNVSVYSIAIAKRVIGEDKEMLMLAGLGGLLHDLGKKEVALELINKPGKLTEEEWLEMKKHPIHGKEILEKVPSVPIDVQRIVHEHHEHIDGSGYPQGLTEEKISQLSKIASIADVFDALTTKRSYKDAVTAAEALDIMVKMAPGKFDQTVFTHLQKNVPNKRDLKMDPRTDPCAGNLKIQKK